MRLGKLFFCKLNLLFLLFIISPLLFQLMRAGNCSAECFYVTGNMSADLSTEQTITFQISGSANKLSYRYFHPSHYEYRTNTQENESFSLTFSVNPATQQQGTDEFGNTYTDLVWTDISDTTLDITITRQATTTAILDPLASSGPFPLSMEDIPKEAQGYMTATGLVQSTDPLIRAKADELVAGCTYQFQAVGNIIKWIINNIDYGANSAYDARSTLIQRRGVCENYSHLACALLRAEGIPVRYVSGVSLARIYDWTVGYTTYSTSWNTGPHAWIEVYYPDLGWVPYDALRDIHHIDVFRIKEAQGRDNNDLSAISWSYFYSAPSVMESESPCIAKIENETVDINCLRKTDEIASGNYALSLDVTPIATQPATQPASSPLPGTNSQPPLSGTSSQLPDTGSGQASSVVPNTGSGQASSVVPNTGRQANSVVPDTGRQANSVVQNPGYGGFGTPSSVYSPTGSFGYGGGGLSGGGFGPVVGYNFAGPTSPFVAGYSSSPYSPTGIFGYGGGSGGGGLSVGATSVGGLSGGGVISAGGFSSVAGYGYGGLSNPSSAAYGSPYGSPYIPASSLSSPGYGGGLSTGGLSGLSSGYGFTNSFGSFGSFGNAGYGGGLSAGGFSPVVGYGYGGFSSPSIAVYTSPYISTSSFGSFGYGGFSSGLFGATSTFF
jgi:transglutaminase-like putative cysteine protease